ncbi:MAG: branched-chain amino acid ABC transporter permease [Burkholderiales bacterium]|nr:branched-chain amino acid ABC transporter permease [Burkholderiales bacterium]
MPGVPAVRSWVRLPVAAAFFAALGGVLLLPEVLSVYQIYLALEVLIFGLAATSLNLLVGYAGMVSFGHAAYFGAASYCAALAMKYAGVSMWTALLVAPLGSTVLAFVYGIFCVRLSRIYFAMLTLAFAQLTYTVAFQWYGVTGGDTGLLGVMPADAIAEPQTYFRFTALVVAACIAVLYAVVRSPFGLTLRSIQQNRVRVELLGVNPYLYQLGAFVIAGFFAGVAGALYAFEKGAVFPDYLSLGHSLKFILMTLLGGFTVFLGPLLGALVFELLNSVLTNYTQYWQLPLAVCLAAVILFAPSGLSGLFLRKR